MGRDSAVWETPEVAGYCQEKTYDHLGVQPASIFQMGSTEVIWLGCHGENIFRISRNFQLELAHLFQPFCLGGGGCSRSYHDGP